MRWLAWGLLCALASIAAGCAAPSADEAASCREWQLMSERLDTGGETLVITVAPPSLAEEDAAKLDRVASAAADSVVWIETTSTNHAAHESSTNMINGGTTALHGPGNGSTSGGTGVVLRSDGVILTNEHVVRGATSIEVVLADGSRHTVQRVTTAERLDLAVLTIGRYDLQPLKPADTSIYQGKGVVAVGGRRFKESAGRRVGMVLRTAASLQNKLDPARQKDYGRLIECTAGIEPGFSGGPLLDAEGQLVGLNVAMTGRPGEANSRGYAIPLDATIRQTVDELSRQ